MFSNFFVDTFFASKEFYNFEPTSNVMNHDIFSLDGNGKTIKVGHVIEDLKDKVKVKLNIKTYYPFLLLSGIKIEEIVFSD